MNTITKTITGPALKHLPENILWPLVTCTETDESRLDEYGCPVITRIWQEPLSYVYHGDNDVVFLSSTDKGKTWIGSFQIDCVADRE